jgi:hypothetical protein
MQTQLIADLQSHDPERPVQYVAPQHSQPADMFFRYVDVDVKGKANRKSST